MRRVNIKPLFDATYFLPCSTVITLSVVVAPGNRPRPLMRVEDAVLMLKIVVSGCVIGAV